MTSNGDKEFINQFNLQFSVFRKITSAIIQLLLSCICFSIFGILVSCFFFFFFFFCGNLFYTELVLWNLKECVKRKVMQALSQNPNCSGLAAKDAMEAVWDVCYNDTQPFDRAP